MTNYMTKEAIMERVRDHYYEAKTKGEVFGVFLQGSQNYVNDLFFEGSDVDTRAVMFPSLEDVLLGKEPTTKEHLMENEEHLDLVDLRGMFKLYKKPGVNNYETMFTEYFVVNPKYQEFYDELVTLREELVRSQPKTFLMSVMGLSHRDMKYLQKRNGSEDSDLERFGYSRKRLSNVMRFNATAKAYLEGKPFSECLKALPQETIYSVRRTHAYNLEEALELAEKLNVETKKLAESYKEESTTSSEVLRKLDELQMKMLMSQFK